ncbi:hypothetical protein JCM19052_602 [Vibrio sp. JCM 19052]|nr:hypothetical protein JCM19052_602 [Vibrio sp. JCM 19052]
MNHHELNRLKNSYEGQRIFQSKEEGYNFDIFSDTWVLGYKTNLYLDWMKSLDSDIFLDLRLAIAHAAKHYASKALKDMSAN